MTTKVASILWGMVTTEIQSYRTHGQDLEAERLAVDLGKAAGLKSPDSALEALSELLVYTKGMTFNWADGTPEGIRALQSLWNRWTAGAPAAEVYRLFSALDTFTLSGRRTAPPAPEVIGWIGAFYQAVTPWEPPDEWKLKHELPTDKAADPISPSVAGQ